ncbi:MAG: aldolase [Kineosporiaceae bacterium]
MPGHAADLHALASARLAADDAAFAVAYPGDPVTRQPVHTCYVPADRAWARTPRMWGDAALALMDRLGPPPGTEGVAERVRGKLEAQPVEDLRIDLEDGYGHRPDAEEDAHAETAGTTLAALGADPQGPFVSGVRVKGLQPGTRARGLRSLLTVVDAARAGDPGWPRRRTVVVLPKAASAVQVATMAEVLATVETSRGLPPGALRLEIQVEVPQALVGADGRIPVAAMISAGAGRLEGLHFGTYDFSAAVGVSGSHQASDHPLADHAKALMQLAASGTGARVADGSTNRLPVGDDDAVLDAWETHARLVRRALRRGLHQGWDLHPGQLVTRYSATYAFLREELAVAASRLRAYVERSPGRGDGPTLDEPATARALAGAVLRGVDCGAVEQAEALAATGLDRSTLDRLAGR